ncbi:hypothetical protein ACS0TY_007162 [Phlomoides rotata]
MEDIGEPEKDFCNEAALAPSSKYKKYIDRQQMSVKVRIARIFNTYGPRMCIKDGHVVSNVVAQLIGVSAEVQVQQRLCQLMGTSAEF